MAKPDSVLLIGGTDELAQSISDSALPPVTCWRVNSVEEAKQETDRGYMPDICILDMQTLDSRGAYRGLDVRGFYSGVLIILVGPDTVHEGAEAVRAGAGDDFFLKDEMIGKNIRYLYMHAEERRRLANRVFTLGNKIDELNYRLGAL